MRAVDLKPGEIIEKDPDLGFPLIGSSRIMAVSVLTLGRLFKDISHLVDQDKKHSILTRLGIEIGMAHAVTISDLYTFDSMEEWLKAGSSLRTMTGYAVESLDEVRIDPGSNLFRFKGNWKGSFESVAHREYHSKHDHPYSADTPVCSVLAGMASGYASVVYGEEVLVREVACQAQGHETCVFEGRPLNGWSENVRELYQNASTIPFEKNLSRIRKHLEKSKNGIRSGRSRNTPAPPPNTNAVPGLVFRSRPMEKTLTLARKVAPTDSTVLILGESGTGKEILARHIHNLSERKESAFLAINCAALPPALLESELFGHVKGAFTGAESDKKGLFAEAGNGTIFLDEVGELPLELQAKFLRALQQKEIRPVGGLKDIPVNARIIAATNRELKSLASGTAFRKDLYYRLAVFPINLPPLRERREDIVIIARYFLNKLKPVNKGISPEAIRVLEKYHWPGNVRELENWIEYAVIMAEGKKILPCHFPEPESPPPPTDSTFFTDDLPTYEEMGLRYIRHILNITGNNKKEASSILNIGTSTLWRHLKKEQEAREISSRE